MEVEASARRAHRELRDLQLGKMLFPPGLHTEQRHTIVVVPAEANHICRLETRRIQQKCWAGTVHEGVDKCVQKDPAENPRLIRSRPVPSVCTQSSLLSRERKSRPSASKRPSERVALTRDHQAVVPGMEKDDGLPFKDEDHRVKQLPDLREVCASF